jgi:hypothetical protein
MPDHCARLKDLSGCLNPDQDDHGCNGCDGRGRVHGDTELAMVGVALDRMEVSHLGYNQQCKQSETQHRDCPKSAWLPAAIMAQLSLQYCQSTILIFKDT